MKLYEAISNYSSQVRPLQNETMTLSNALKTTTLNQNLTQQLLTSLRALPILLKDYQFYNNLLD